MHTIDTVPALFDLEGTDLGTTDWITITQDQVDTFADVTDDHQWIHVDRERALTGPFGHTVAHGMLTLAFVPVLVGGVLTVENASFGLNYGFDKVRFTSPVRAGERVRAHVTVLRTLQVPGGVRATFGVTVEGEDTAKTVLYAENIIQWLE
ncbi:MAG: MaoC family dehydratase [Aeromicrobium sp.]